MFGGHTIFLNPDLKWKQCSAVVIWNLDLAVYDVHWKISVTTRFVRPPDFPLCFVMSFLKQSIAIMACWCSQIKCLCREYNGECGRRIYIIDWEKFDRSTSRSHCEVSCVIFTMAFAWKASHGLVATLLEGNGPSRGPMRSLEKQQEQTCLQSLQLE